MSGLKDSVEEAVLDYILGNENPSYIALFLTAPTDSTLGAEVSGGAYARQAITLTRTAQTLSNTNTITFPEATVDWGTVVAFAITTAVTAGTQVIYGNLPVSKTIVKDEEITIEIGEFTWTID
jgi:hypothetical protein